MGTVIGTAGAGDLYMMVIGEDQLIDLLCQFFGVIACKRTQVLSGTGNHVPGAGCRIAFPGLSLVDSCILDDQLQFLIDFISIFDSDMRNLKTLAVGQLNNYTLRSSDL